MTSRTKKFNNPAESSFLSNKNKVIATVAIVLIVLIIMANGAFAQDHPTKASPGQMVEALHAAFGKHPNARAVHAKGIILEGFFVPTPMAKSLSKAAHFQGKKIPVTYRFSVFTGIPDIPDTIGAANPRGLAIKFYLPDGSSTDIVSHSFDGFPVSTTDEFREFLLAISKSGPDATHPSPIEQFLETHPIAKAFVKNQKSPSVSYGTLSYYGVNTFKFINKNDLSTLIRYQFIPEEGESFLTPEQVKTVGSDYLAKEIVERLGKSPVKYKMYAQISQQGDKTEDPGIAWPKNRKLILLGVLTINQVTENTLAEDKALLFNPGNLPKGIEISDQMLLDRQRSYPISVAERNQ